VLALTKLEKNIQAIHGKIDFKEVDELDPELVSFCFKLLYMDIDDLPKPCIELLAKLRSDKIEDDETPF